jgi:DNA-binding transcriptional ArsR family regulator
MVTGYTFEKWDRLPQARFATQSDLVEASEGARNRQSKQARNRVGDVTVNQLAEPYRMTLQAVYKHLRVLEDAGLVSRPHGPQPRPVHLETKVFDLMEARIERYRRWTEQRYRRLDAVLAAMNETDDKDEADHDQDHGDNHRG